MPDNEIFTAAVIPEEALDPVSVPIGIFEYSEGSIAAPYVQVKTGRDFVVIDDLYVEGDSEFSGDLDVGGDCEIAGNLTVETDFKTHGATVLEGATTISSSSNAIDVTGKTVFYISTIANDVTIGGFANGVLGQIIYVAKSSSAHNMIVEHNKASGTQKIITPTAADITFGTYGGFEAVYVGSNWRITSYSNS